ncbi:MAG: hypothetical protein JO339_27185 [Alphaproteobacteria bacterium]|nr:hypothetical protein [Alphaproteobacteria bacterium]
MTMIVAMEHPAMMKQSGTATLCVSSRRLIHPPVARDWPFNPGSSMPMFTEIRHAVLPLALRKLRGGNELERAALLIESLARHWRDRRPLQLLIVSPERDVDKVQVRLPAFPNVLVSVYGEREFFPRFSSFYAMPGWYRQQIVKLLVPAALALGGYLTLDADVFCVDDFDATTFIQDGRALSRWEPKRQHAWWQRTARYVGVPYDAAAHGLSVTPNVLHSDLSDQALEHVGRGLLSWQVALSLRILSRIGTVPWTEYALYTSAAERAGNLFDYHVHWDDCYCQVSQVFSEHSSIWHASDFAYRIQHMRRNPSAKFIVVQSKPGLSMDAVRQYCLTVDSRMGASRSELLSQ